MFKVECPSCKAPYQVDERRVPETGLKMRCPKCATSFQVDPPPEVHEIAAGPAIGAGPPRPKRAHKATMLGVALPPGGNAAPPAPPPPAPPPPTPVPDDDWGLPIVGGSRSAGDSSRAPAAAPELDLGATEEAGLPAPRALLVGQLDLPSPVARGPALPAPPRPGRTQAGIGELELDLDLPGMPSAPPASVAGKGREAPVDDLPDLELPSPVLRRQPLPAPAGKGREAPVDDLPDLELPSPVLRRPPLPAPAGRGREAPVDDLPDLELPSPVLRRQPLPAPVFAPVPVPGDTEGFDLPLVGTAGATDLPSPAGVMDLPSPAGVMDLPSPAGVMDLPSPAGVMDLPSLGGELDLPSPSAAMDLPSPGGLLDLPSPGGAPRLGGSSGPPGPLLATMPGMPAAATPASSLDAFGDLELPLVGHPSGPPNPHAATLVGSGDPFSAPLPLPPMPAPAPLSPPVEVAAPSVQPLSRQVGGGGTDYGEVSLDASAPGVFSLDAEVPAGRSGGDDDMEFGAIPQEDEAEPAATSAVDVAVPAAGAAATAAVRPAKRAARPEERPARKRRSLKVAVGVIVTLSVAGGSMALIPAVGPFGYYTIEGLVKGKEYRALVTRTAAETRTRLAADTFPEAKRALSEIEYRRVARKRLKALAAYQAYAAYLFELRFGQDPQVRARAEVLLDELSEVSELDYLELARTAREAVTGNPAQAQRGMQALLRGDASNVDALVLRGELLLRTGGDAKESVAAWRTAAAAEQSARTAFGLARALHAAGDLVAAERQAKAAVQASAGHVGARILLARLAWAGRAGEQRAIELLNRAQQTRNASPTELAELQTLLGDIHLARSRISRAETAYSEALRVNPKAGQALRGLGEALYRAGRYTEALARFEAALQADANDVVAKVGIAKLQIALERLQDAGSALAKLRQAHPKSMLVAVWQGRAAEALGNREQAEEAYRHAIQCGEQEPGVVEPYVALAMILNSQGREEDARKTLDEARQKLPDSPMIHQGMGDLALKQGRYEQALVELRAALALDPEDVGTRFRLGVALRYSRQFDEAQRAFDAVAQVDRDYPGLALERGLLFEESGRTAEALAAYEAALAKAPNDTDLMLRVGCGQVAAERSKRATELLRKVLAQRPQSAETNHCLGRALLLDSNLAEAIKKLERAVQLDPNRAGYHLFVGWAANEAGDSFKAQQSLERALALDRSLADAYWQRGILAYRQGRVKDAVTDLRRALELKPGRREAHAALADAYYDLGMETLALGEWRMAVEANPNEPRWRYRFGKLLAANNNGEAAQVQLLKALELAATEDPKPRWMWDAHLLLARSFGARTEAIQHWEAFLQDAPLDSPYRAEAQAALRALGKPWRG